MTPPPSLSGEGMHFRPGRGGGGGVKTRVGCRSTVGGVVSPLPLDRDARDPFVKTCTYRKAPRPHHIHYFQSSETGARMSFQYCVRMSLRAFFLTPSLAFIRTSLEILSSLTHIYVRPSQRASTSLSVRPTPSLSPLPTDTTGVTPQTEPCRSHHHQREASINQSINQSIENYGPTLRLRLWLGLRSAVLKVRVRRCRCRRCGCCCSPLNRCCTLQDRFSVSDSAGRGINCNCHYFFA